MSVYETKFGIGDRVFTRESAHHRPAVYHSDSWIEEILRYHSVVVAIKIEQNQSVSYLLDEINNVQQPWHPEFMLVSYDDVHQYVVEKKEELKKKEVEEEKAKMALVNKLVGESKAPLPHELSQQPMRAV